MHARAHAVTPALGCSCWHSSERPASSLHDCCNQRCESCGLLLNAGCALHAVCTAGAAAAVPRDCQARLGMHAASKGRAVGGGSKLAFCASSRSSRLAGRPARARTHKLHACTHARRLRQRHCWAALVACTAPSYAPGSSRPAGWRPAERMQRLRVRDGLRRLACSACPAAMAARAVLL